MEFRNQCATPTMDVAACNRWVRRRVSDISTLRWLGVLLDGVGTISTPSALQMTPMSHTSP
jgi:hypothetical protein